MWINSSKSLIFILEIGLLLLNSATQVLIELPNSMLNWQGNNPRELCNSEKRENPNFHKHELLWGILLFFLSDNIFYLWDKHDPLSCRTRGSQKEFKMVHFTCFLWHQDQEFARICCLC